jgi:microcystin-dependent protein
MAHVRHAYQTETANNDGAEISSNEWNEDHDTDGLMPPGAMAAFAGSSAPTGWLLCDGSAVSRSTYSALFSAISTTFGTGDGSTTFNVPNLQGRIPVGRDSGQTEFDTLGETGGAKTHTLETSEIPAHSHTITDPGHAHTQTTSATDGATTRADSSSGGTTYNNVANINSNTTGITINNAGGGGAHNNLQPYVVANWIIKT